VGVDKPVVQLLADRLVVELLDVGQSLAPVIALLAAVAFGCVKTSLASLSSFW